MDEVTYLKILQWNSRSIKSNKPSFVQYICIFEADICLISETWLNTNDIFSLGRYNIVRSDRTDKRGGGAALFIKNKFEYLPINFIDVRQELDIYYAWIL